MERYIKILKSYKRMPLELETTLRENVHPMVIRKHEVFQPIGTVTDDFYFVEKGLLRIFILEKGEQVTFRFKKEDNFIITLRVLFPEESEQEQGIQALEDSILWRFPGSLVDTLTKKFPQFQRQYCTILQKDVMAMQERRRCSRPGWDSSNYDRLRLYSPELLDRVPIPYLPSYTSIPENVFRHLHSSRIKLNMSSVRRRKR
ncbi:Crp/Fnr family transcriptional regulator [Puia dinghuensis]|uniref:Cyclic nucleotide-binding domain-containing protein n=1 Tax=Puia dinghuensis TaxID=1792502 RepID=A0A8J2XWH4_9BACT|nr:cyclic nucleotide-binding domain-containing protein [Puia dinghuensis]GGB23819.1 hypothetical protein GCM10011511_54630 [Puia dinghuensis]